MNLLREVYTRNFVGKFLSRKKNLQDMSNEALEMQDEKHIHGARIPKVRMFLMIK
jgi:hypothetical protein